MYTVVFRAEVVMDNESAILTREQQREMLRVLETTPRSQKPLTRGLRGCYRWRHSAVRVVYAVDDVSKTVTVIAIGQRRDDEIYHLAERRM